MRIIYTLFGILAISSSALCQEAPEPSSMPPVSRTNTPSSHKDCTEDRHIYLPMSSPSFDQPSSWEIAAFPFASATHEERTLIEAYPEIVAQYETARVRQLRFETGEFPAYGIDQNTLVLRVQVGDTYFLLVQNSAYGGSGARNIKPLIFIGETTKPFTREMSVIPLYIERGTMFGLDGIHPQVSLASGLVLPSHILMPGLRTFAFELTIDAARSDEARAQTFSELSRTSDVWQGICK